jgi:hypothetical protein
MLDFLRTSHIHFNKSVRHTIEEIRVFMLSFIQVRCPSQVFDCQIIERDFVVAHPDYYNLEQIGQQIVLQRCTALLNCRFQIVSSSEYRVKGKV